MSHLMKLPAQFARTFSSSARRLRNKVPEAQRLFQGHFTMFTSKAKPTLDPQLGIRFVVLGENEDNGLPVHLKGGGRDVLLYRATMTLTLAGSFYSLYCLFRASMPQKK